MYAGQRPMPIGEVHQAQAREDGVECALAQTEAFTIHLAPFDVAQAGLPGVLGGKRQEELAVIRAGLGPVAAGGLAPR
jgi:hypothetical protein